MRLILQYIAYASHFIIHAYVSPFLCDASRSHLLKDACVFHSLNSHSVNESQFARDFLISPQEKLVYVCQFINKSSSSVSFCNSHSCVSVLEIILSG